MDETDSQITCADSSVDKLSHLKRNEVKSCPLPELHGADEMLPELNKSCLTNPDILRYSRQLVLPDLGVQGQLKLSKASVLVIGCGGLGCPVAQYLAASGIGRLGLLDYDVVEMSNLHRQVLHGENRLGMSKSVSVAKTLRKLNSAVVYLPYHISLNPENALQIIQQYDIIADCSDNVPTRYLVNDTCVLAGKPLVSASALRWEGQLTVYNYHQGPCYRCLFPKPPPSETVTNCADGGVLGIVPGIIGSLQALEVLKIASGMAPSYSGVLLMFDALEGRFRNIKIRGKKNDCAACSNPSETAILQDYEAFCGSSASDKCRMLRLLSRDERLSVEEYKRLLDDHVPHILMDVRPQPEVDICRLPHSIRIPLSVQKQLITKNSLYLCLKAIDIPLKGLEEKNEKWVSFLRTKIAELITAGNRTEKTVITICKLGNDSQIAVKILQDLFGKEDLFIAKDVQGGLMAWAENIDPMFPRY